MLFNIIPDNFFGPLAAPGRLIYWECLSRIFSVTNRLLSYGVERDVLVDELQFYFDSVMSADLPGEEDAAGMSSRDKANFILRRLESYGWITIETDHSYVQRVNFQDYAIVLMRTLLEISEKKETEYQAYIYTVYSLTRSLQENPGIGLIQIVENTDHLLTGLKSLNANIKQYIDELTDHSSIPEILDALLNDYYSNVVDKAYHRLMTSDNVSKYRPEILERLERSSREEQFLRQASREIAQIRECSEEEGREQVLTMLHDVIETFRSMDAILDEINQKNAKYQRAAINRARFLLTSGDDIRGQLKNILGYLNEQMTEKKLDMNAVYELEEMDGLIRLFSWEYLDIDSLYAPIEGRREFIPEKVAVTSMNPAMREEKRRQMMARMERVLSPDRIERYVEELLGDRSEIRASELPIATEDTFIRLIYIRLYGQRKRMHYKLRMLDTVEKDGYRFRDFMIIRKGNKD